MKRVPTSFGDLKRSFIILVLALTFGPVALVVIARHLEPIFVAVLPWALALGVIYGLYRLVIRRYHR